MKVESIAEWSLKPIFGLFESGRLRQVLLYVQVTQQILTEADVFLSLAQSFQY